MVNIMTPLAEIMVQEPFKNGTAAPAFQFYKTKAGEDPSKVDEAAKELQKAITLHLQRAIDAASEKAEALRVIKFSAKNILWPVN